MKALALSVYRNTLGDCTNGGASGKHDELFVVCDEGPFDIDENDERLFRLRTRSVFGRNLVELVPYRHNGGLLFDGGNYAGTSDSRFSQMTEKATGYPCRGVLPVFDRVETQEEYNASSI